MYDQIGFTFLVPVHLGSPGKRAVKRVCVCACVRACVRVCYMYDQFITVPAELSVSSELEFSDGQFSYWQKIFSAFKHNKSR